MTEIYKKITLVLKFLKLFSVVILAIFILRGSLSTQAAAVYACPVGSTLQGTNCISAAQSCPAGYTGPDANSICTQTQTTYSCPNGGVLQNTNCVATIASPVLNGPTPKCNLNGIGGLGAGPFVLSTAPPTTTNLCRIVPQTLPDAVPSVACPSAFYASSRATFPLTLKNFNGILVCGFNNVQREAAGFYYWDGAIYGGYSYAATADQQILNLPAGCVGGIASSDGTCSTPASLTGFVIDNISQIGTGNCTTTQNVQIGTAVNCIFPFVGIPSGVPITLGGGVRASINTAQGSSNLYSIQNGNLVVTGIPTVNGSAGNRSVSLAFGNSDPTIKGSVNLTVPIISVVNNANSTLTTPVQTNNSKTVIKAQILKPLVRTGGETNLLPYLVILGVLVLLFYISIKPLRVAQDHEPQLYGVDEVFANQNNLVSSQILCVRKSEKLNFDCIHRSLLSSRQKRDLS